MIFMYGYVYTRMYQAVSHNSVLGKVQRQQLFGNPNQMGGMILELVYTVLKCGMSNFVESSQ